MRFDSLNADLRRWLQSSIEAGHDGEALQQALRTSGYDANFARQVVGAALARLRPSARTAAAPSRAETARPRPAAMPSTARVLDGAANTIATSDRTVEILLALGSPRLMLFGEFLSADECEQLIALADRRLQRSTVVNADTGAYDEHPDRTSSGTHFEKRENGLIARIERRIGELLDCPEENGEPIQVLHYRAGAEYKPHHDYFDTAQRGNERVLAMGGQRVATLIMYLNHVEAGGSTVFPTLGLDVRPRRGAALYFTYCNESGDTDARTLHGGTPVVAGEKWIATKWLRQRAYGAAPG
jgi:prolyl 4-hydroxylase